MKILIISFFLIGQVTFSHENERITKVYGNVKINISSGFFGERTNKSLIIAQYAEMLSKKYNYVKPIELNFFEDLKKDFLFGYLQEINAEDSIFVETLHLRFHKKEFDAVGCLNIIEYAILNSKQIEFQKNKLASIYHSDPSSTVYEILKNKIYRPNEIEELSTLEFTYYYQNDQFYCVALTELKNEVVLYQFKDILYFKGLNKNILIIVTNHDELKIVNTSEHKNLTSLKIYNPDKFYLPIKAHLLNNNVVLFTFNYLSINRERIMLFFIDKKILIQNIDELIKY